MLDPRGVVPGDVKPAARRPASLRGLRIGVLDNSKPNADVLLGRIAELLAARVGGASIHGWTLTPEDIMVIVAGGPGKHSVIVPTFGATRSVTVRI